MNKPEKIILTEEIKMKGLELGFAKVGITTADVFDAYIHEISADKDYGAWLDNDMSFHVASGANPKQLFPEAKSIVCVIYGYGDIIYPIKLSKSIGYSYLSRCYSPLKDASCGLRVEALKNFLKAKGCKVYEGNVAVPARRACARAGIVDFGKNNFAYTKNEGSFILLYTFIIDTELVYDSPTVHKSCPDGCNKCIEACPTNALLPGKLIPSKCILFNNMGPFPIPNDIRDGIGVKIHGCDLCQQACPRNKNILNRASRRDYFLEKIDKEFDLGKILLMDGTYYKRIVYPIMHNYIKDINFFRRNAAIAIGNSGDKNYIPLLLEALKYDNEQVVDAVQWALKKLRGN